MPNTKVYFKKGQQQSLDALQTYQDGSFYLTTDTHRLYFAESSSSLVDLNQYIHFVSSYSSLPSASSSTLKDGDIYYLQSENILCVYQASATPSWVQINPDTRLAGGQNQVMSVDAETNGANIGVSISDSGTPARVAEGDFTILGGSNVHVSVNGNTVTIASDNDNDNTTYTIGTQLETTKGTINLTPSTGTGTSIDIVGDGSNVNVSSDANGTITISGNAGITGISDGFDANGEYGIEITRTTGAALSTAGVVPTITYGNTGGTLNAVFANGTATLNIYTKDQVDSLINSRFSSLDALKYAGTVSHLDAATKIVAAPVNGVGTVYKASDNFQLTSPSLDVKTGDLLIAYSTTNDDEHVDWELVPAGDDTILNITGSVAENLVTFNDVKNNTSTALGTIEISGTAAGASGAGITVTTTVDNNNKDTTFTLSHGTSGTGTAVTAGAVDSNSTQVTGSNLDIPIITGLSKDANGHITSITAQTYRFKDTHATLSPITVTTDALNNEASVTLGFQLDSTNRTASFGVTSDTLTVTADDTNDNIIVDLEWGSF